MRFQLRDLTVPLEDGVLLMPGGPAPTGCVCTQTAAAPCPYPSLADLVTDRAVPVGPGSLNTLRRQLRAELRTSG